MHDPACGTGGFLLAAWDRMKKAGDRRAQLRARDNLSGIDIVPDVVRLCAMNMYLHGAARDKDPILRADALNKVIGHYDVVLTNPPFGNKQGYKIVGDDGDIETEREEYNREDFIKTTSNKQLNFLQHIMSILNINGRCGVVLPDNVLFEGAGAEIRKRLLDNYDFHTLLRLPTGIFYKQGVKANVLFFDRKPASETPWTKEPMDLRFPHQPALHAERAADEARRPRRFRRLLLRRPIAPNARKASASANSPTPTWSSATRSISIFSGSRTTRSTIPTCCRRRTKLLPRSSKAWKQR